MNGNPKFKDNAGYQMYRKNFSINPEPVKESMVHRSDADLTKRKALERYAEIEAMRDIDDDPLF